MGHFSDRSYRFATAAQWEAGAMTGFDPDGDRLTLSPPRVARRLAGSDADSLATVDACGRPVWLRRSSGELVRLYDFGPEVQGRLDVEAPVALFMGPTRLWVQGPSGVTRFDARTLQELGSFDHPRLIASAGDGCDGLWLLIRSRRGAYVRHIDGRGCLARTRLPLLCAVRPIALAAAFDGTWLAVLDSPEEARAPTANDWRLHIVDLAACRTAKPHCFKLRSDDEQPPRHLAIDARGRIHLAGSGEGAPLQSVSRKGEEVARQTLRLRPSAWPVSGLLWGDALLLVAADGLHRLERANAEDGDAGVSRGVFMTPPLISPDGSPSGWNRADIEVEMPEEATLTISFASYGEAEPETIDDIHRALASSALASTSGSAAAPGATGDPPIDWAEDTRTYHGRAEAKRMLRFLLDGAREKHLWLKLAFECPAGASPVSLRSLRVRYPDRSWLDDLPAIYREDEGSAVQLRRFLAPIEALYGDLSETIDSLPGRIDPSTAKDEWLPWLLEWLGFPPTAGLGADIQRRLLSEAGTLLQERGTQSALERMLDIVTRGRARVRDSGASAAFWVLSSRRTRLTARLGCETRVVAHLPADFVLGRKDLRLGEAPLGRTCTDVAALLCANCGLVSIQVELEAERRALVEPIVRSLIDMFVPAFCRIELDVGLATRALPAGRLDDAMRLDGGRLADPRSTELGRITRPGGWQLPPSDIPPIPIDGTAAPNGARRLA
ncbi:MAG TPA: phage tail protein [Allosphingosinicella sp.]|nr:phage tail protein [Allosphingosinicella sp.]